MDYRIRPGKVGSIEPQEQREQYIHEEWSDNSKMAQSE